MGHTQAQGMVEAINEGLIDLRVALEWHLTANHYPPIRGMTDIAVAVVNAANVGEWDLTQFTLPDGREATLTDPYGRMATAGDLVEAWHLGDFLEPDAGEW